MQQGVCRYQPRRPPRVLLSPVRERRRRTPLPQPSPQSCCGVRRRQVGRAGAGLLHERPGVTPAGAVHGQHTLAQQTLHPAPQGGDLGAVEELGDAGRHGLGQRGDVL